MRQVLVGRTQVELVTGDIVHAGTEALVTAANASLAGGGGVDGAVHRAAGPRLLAALRPIGHCAPGSAVMTPAFDLPEPVKCVIHAVGPVYFIEGPERSADLLRGAYTAALRLCEEERLRSVAFPSISTGAYGYPVHRAAPVAITAILEHLHATPGTSLELVRLVLFDERIAQAYEKALDQALTGNMGA
ncbi:MAG TPA: macro domain-containing protein [Ktedonobacterales bacterium]